VLLWWVDDDPKLRGDVRKTVADPDHDIEVSAASIWQAAITRAVGKLRFETPVVLDVLRRGGLRILPITAEHALAAGGLSRLHDDPFDRMLVAQARAEHSHPRHARRKAARFPNGGHRGLVRQAAGRHTSRRLGWPDGAP
jgi:PIN domain nuclease of toxin-antitoxin system